MKVPPRKSTVLVADAEPVSRHGLVQLINCDVGLRVCGETGRARDARELCRKLQPQIVILDVAMDGGEGFALLKELPRWAKGARVVVFTSLEDALSMQRAFLAGAAGYFNRRDPGGALVEAIHAALAGQRAIGPRAVNLLLERLASGGLVLQGSPEAALSERELQVYRLFGAGRSAREVAAELRLSVKTIDTHRQRMKEKLGLANGVELQRRATLFHHKGGAA